MSDDQTVTVVLAIDDSQLAPGLERAASQIDESMVRTKGRVAGHSKDMFKPIENSFSHALSGVIVGSESIGKAMQQVERSIVQTFVKANVDRVVAWLSGETQMTEGTTAGVGARQAAENSAGQASALSSFQRSFAKIANSAQETFAGVSAFLSPILGPFAVIPAAGAAAVVLAAQAALTIPSSAGGWRVPGDMLGMIHQDETILPARYSAGLDRLVGQAADGGDNGGSSGSGDVHLHVTAVDGASVARLFSDNRAALATALRQAQRDGAMVTP